MLELKNISKYYGKQNVLKDLSLRVEPGEIYGLLGANGAGKTTLINIICNLLKADTGEVLINGRSQAKSSKKIIGIAPQENLIYKTLTCEENLNFFAKIYGINSKERRQRIESSLAAVNLLNRAKSPAETLSGGMQRRLNIAIALVHQPKLVILDEPTTGLDIEARYEIWELIKSLKNQGMTVLLTTHILDEAERLCQRIGILKQGNLIAEGTLEELQKRVPGKEIILIETSDEASAINQAQNLGLIHRRYANQLAFISPQNWELKEIIEKFEGVSLNSISRQPVRLEHIYLEVTQSIS